MPSSFVRLYLVRHGEVDANRELRYLGHRDDPLNATGQRQAAQLAEAFSSLAIDSVVTSPLVRARATADAIGEATGAPVATDDRLLELDFGRWEGRTRAEVLNEDGAELETWERDPARETPGGDSLAAVGERVRDLANELLVDRARSDIVLVSHVGPIKTLLNKALGLPPAAWSRVFLDPATISVVDWSTRPLVRLVNSHAHLGWSTPRWLDQRM